ncbi:nuclear transport factor 2 family protein [Spirillospora sp. CA-108201]
MPETLTPREVFLRLVHGVCEERWEEVIELYAEQPHVEHPFHPLAVPSLESLEELRAHFGIGAPSGTRTGSTLRRQPVGITVHETADPEVIVAEFRYEGIVVETGEPFTVPAIFVMRVRDGKIVESRDYLDHLRSAQARGQLKDVLAAVGRHYDR